MHMRTTRLVRKGMGVALAAAMVTASLPTAALAAEVNDAQAAVTAGLGAVPAAETSLDKDNLADGTYEVQVGMRQAVDPTQDSMANNALADGGKATLDVVKGEYYLTLGFQGMEVMDKMGYLGSLSYFDEGYTVNGAVIKGDLVEGAVVENLKDANGNDVIDPLTNKTTPGKVQIKIVKQALADENGLVPVQVFVPMMESLSAGAGTQNAYVQVDWSTLREAGTTEEVDKSALDQAVSDAEALTQGNKTDAAFKTLQDAIAAAKEVQASDSATQDEVDAAVKALNSAVATFNASDDKPEDAVAVEDMKEGYLYEVPITMPKYADPTQSSMAAGYFNKTAYVVPQADGTYVVRLTMNQHVDYMEDMEYDVTAPTSASDPKGTQAKVLSEGVFEIKVKSLTEDSVVSFKVKPMFSNWAAAYLRFDTSAIKDLGKKDDGSAGEPDETTDNENDSNTTATKPTATKPTTSTTKPATTAKTAATASKTTSKTLPKTSDDQPMVIATLAVAGAGMLGAAEAMRRRKSDEEA